MCFYATRLKSRSCTKKRRRRKKKSQAITQRNLHRHPSRPPRQPDTASRHLVLNATWRMNLCHPNRKWPRRLPESFGWLAVGVTSDSTSSVADIDLSQSKTIRFCQPCVVWCLLPYPSTLSVRLFGLQNMSVGLLVCTPKLCQTNPSSSA